MEKSDHDLLIELKTTAELVYKEQSRMMTDHMENDAKSFNSLELKVNAAHKRMDTLVDKIDDMTSLKDKVLGGACVLMFLFSSILTVITIIQQ